MPFYDMYKLRAWYGFEARQAKYNSKTKRSGVTVINVMPLLAGALNRSIVGHSE